MSRTAGAGRVFKKDGVWGYYFRHDGRPVRRSDRRWTKQDALAAKRKAEAKAGAGYTDRTAREVTFDDLAQLIKDDYAVNGNRSTASMGFRLARLEEFFRKDGLASGIEARWPVYLRKRLGEAKPSTVQYELAVLRRMFKLGYQRNPRMVEKLLDIPSLKFNNAAQGFFEPEQRENVLALLPEDLRPFVEFLALTSWRPCEAKWLTWRNVEFKGGTMTLGPGITKNSEGRTLYFASHPRLAALLKNQRERAMAAGVLKPDMPVFFRVFKGGIRPVKNFRKAWRTARREAGCEGKQVYDTRRTCIRDMERAGISRSVSMAISGHKTEAIFRRYAIVSSRDHAQAMAQLAKSQEQGGADEKVKGA